MRTPRTKQILCDARDRRREIGIVRTAFDNRLFLDQGLVFPVEIKSRLDRHWTVRAEDPFGYMRASEVAHLSSGIRVQLEFPHNPVGR